MSSGTEGETSPLTNIRALLDDGIEQPDGGLDYAAIAEKARVLGGARFAVFNEVVAQGSRTVTRAIAGDSQIIKKAVSLLDLRLVGTSYAMDATILDAMEEGGFRRFESGAVLSRAQFPPRLLEPLARILKVGPFIVRGLNVSGTPAANLILIFGAGGELENGEACELYADLLELLLERHYEGEAASVAAYLASGVQTEALPADAIFSAAEHLPELVYELDATGKILFINQRIEEYGYNRQELLGKSVFELVHPEDRDRAKWHVNERRSGDRRTRSFEVRILSRSARTVFLEGRELSLADVATLELEAEGLYEGAKGESSFRGTLGIARDISERKLLESELAERLSIFRELANHVGEPIWLEESAGGRLLYRNPSAAKLLGPLPANSEDHRRWFLERVHREDREGSEQRLEDEGLLLREGVECRISDAAGVERRLLCRYYPVPAQKGRSAKRVVIAIDRTEEHAREEKLRQQVSHEQAYVREMSHRVKNNLAMIHSMINLEKVSKQDSTTEDLLERIQGRIRAVGSVHELLYRNSWRKSVEITGYLRQLATGVVAGTASRSTVDLEFDFSEEVWVDLERSIPLGMIVTELVTNALKHAFPGGVDGRIRISLNVYDNEATLQVADDGAGLPEGSDSETPYSIGHDLVEALAEQVGGSFSSQRLEGETVLTLRFSLQ